ncbi:MAG: hypothetical protein ACN6OV_02015 [Acinetobacter sp.]
MKDYLSFKDRNIYYKTTGDGKPLMLVEEKQVQKGSLKLEVRHFCS